MVKRFNLPPSHPDRINVILASTGSVATIKIPILLDALRESGKYNIIHLPSHTSCNFMPQVADHQQDEGDVVVTFRDADEWVGWERGDEILHVELRRWCDILLVAPLSAHSLAKICAGLCDTLLLEVLRAWDYQSTPVRASLATDNEDIGSVGRRRVLGCAPAMNTAMFTHPLTATHLAFMRDTLHFDVLGPIEKTLACGDVGNGAMVEVPALLDWLERASLVVRGQ